MREPRGPVDLLDMDTTGLDGFDAVGNFPDCFHRSLSFGARRPLELFVHFISAISDQVSMSRFSLIVPNILSSLD